MKGGKLALSLGLAIGLSVVGSSAWADGVAPGAHAVPLMTSEQVQKVREEVRINEGRAKELDPVIARDRQARRDVETDWGVLERHARELHARAAEFRSWAATLGGKAQADLNQYAADFDLFATHDEENARFKHEVAERLEKAISGEVAARDWHVRTAQRLREWLTTNGN